MSTEFPVKYLNVLDTILERESFAKKYEVNGAEFVNAKTVMVPEITFETGTNAYDRFETEDAVELHYESYTLDYDRQKQFYVDAVDNGDEDQLRVANAVAEFTRTKLIPEIDLAFFSDMKTAAATAATTTLSAANIKGELRKARKQLVNAGINSADLYMTSDALALLEDATNRQWANEGTVNTMIGHYDIFDIYEVPADRMTGIDFIAIGHVEGAQNAIRHIVKRAVNYLFEPGKHTKGDGWLAQMRWVYGNIALKNKTAAIYENGTARE